MNEIEDDEKMEDDDESEVILAGWMEKKGNHTRASYTTRYFILKSDGLIYYYKYPKQHTLQGTLNLKTIKQVITPIDKPCKFKLISINLTTNTFVREWKFKVISEQNKSKWVECINKQRKVLQNIILEGMLQKKGYWNTEFKQRYFILTHTELGYVTGRNRDYKTINLYNIGKVQSVDVYNLGYYEFHLIPYSDSGRKWILRTRNKSIRDEWAKQIQNQCDLLPLTLTRYQEILSEKKVDIIEQYDHVLHYHCSIDPEIIKTLKCNKRDSCLSLKRANRTKQRKHCRNGKYSKERYLQDLFDKMHFHLYHNNLQNGNENSLQFIRKRSEKWIIDSINIKNENQTTNTKHSDENNPMPSKYGMGEKMAYCYHEPGEKCLKDELIPHIGVDCFNAELEFCKILKQDNRAKLTTANTVNDNFVIKFSGKIEIQHLLAVRCYCGYSNLCYSFRKSYRNKNNNQSSKSVKKDHYKNFYFFGRFLYESTEFYGTKRKQQKMYIGMSARFTFHSTIIQLFQPTSATDQKDIAEKFAKSAEKGIIIELAPQFNELDAKSSSDKTRGLFAAWISPFGHESETIYYGYDSTTLIKDVHIWSKGQKDWKSLAFQVNALNYWDKIITQYSGFKNYNISFNNGNMTRKGSQNLLATLIDFELDYYVTINVSKLSKDTKYIYDFGDNTPKKITTDSMVKHQYLNYGTYIITVSVEDNPKLSAKLTQRVVNPYDINNHDYDGEIVTVNEPYAAVSCTKIQDKQIEFDASKSCDMNGNKCDKFEWDFGDESQKVTTLVPIIQHQYERLGTYTVNVNVFDKHGFSSIAELTMNIEGDTVNIMVESSPANAKPKAHISHLPSDGFRYTQQWFHNMLESKIGNIPKSRSDKLLDVDFTGIQNEKITPRLRKHLFVDPKAASSERVIDPKKIFALFPHLQSYVDEKGVRRDKNGSRVIK